MDKVNMSNYELEKKNLKFKIDAFIENNCKHCSLRKPSKKTKCELWNGLVVKSRITIDNMYLFWNEDGSCMYFKGSDNG